MTKPSTMKIALLMLMLIVIPTGEAYATGLTDLRILIRNMETGSTVVITDNGDGDGYAQDDGIVFINALLDGTWIGGTVAVSEGGSATDGFSKLTLSVSTERAAGSGGGTLGIILENKFAASMTDGSYSVALGQALADPTDALLPLSGEGFIDGGSVRVETYANTSGAVPDLGPDLYPAANTSGLPTIDDVLPSFKDTFTDGAISGGTGPVGLTFTQAAYSQYIYALVTLDADTSIADFSVQGDVRIIGGDPLTSHELPEPSSLLLLGSGLLALGMLRRKKGSL